MNKKIEHRQADTERTLPPLRIVVASESPLGDINGVTNSVRQSLKYLRGSGHEAIVVCPKPAPKEFAGFEVITTRSVPFQGFNLGVPGPHKVPRIIERFEPDVVHVASPAWTIGRTALLGAAHFEVPSVAIYQTDIVNYARRFRVNAITTRAERTMAMLHNLATRNLAPSMSARNDLIAYGVNQASIHQWARGVDSEKFHPDRRLGPDVEALRQQFLCGDTRPIIGYIGRLAVEKRVERLASLKDLDARLVIVGDGPMRPRLETILPDDTIFTGELRGNKLANAYAALDIFIHTGTQETFGQTLQEAMASGLPVIAPAAGGPLDIVKHDVTGLLYSPENDDHLRRDAQRLIDNKDERESMGQQGRLAVEQRTWHVLGQELVQHYRQAIAEESL